MHCAVSLTHWMEAPPGGCFQSLQGIINVSKSSIFIWSLRGFGADVCSPSCYTFNHVSNSYNAVMYEQITLRYFIVKLQFLQSRAACCKNESWCFYLAFGPHCPFCILLLNNQIILIIDCFSVRDLMCNVFVALQRKPSLLIFLFCCLLKRMTITNRPKRTRKRLHF